MRVLIPYDENQARNIANIVGESSAFALALKELERRREAGEEVRLWRCENSIIVGPIPREDNEDGAQR